MRKMPKIPGKLKHLSPKTGLPPAAARVRAETDAAEYILASGGLDPAAGGGGAYTYIGLAAAQNTDYFYSFADPSNSGGVEGLYLAPGSGNKLIVSCGKGRAPAFVFGGVAENSADDVSGNYVHYSGGQRPASVLVGGFSHRGDAAGNKVVYRGGALTGVIYQTHRYAIVGGGALGDGDGANPSAVGNRVFVSGEGDIAGSIVGGMVFNENSSGGKAKGNKVTVSGYGGTVTGDVIGGVANSGDAAGNSVEYGGGNITGKIIGGNATNNYGNAQDNSVVVDGADNLGGAVLGGVAGYNTTGSATGNTVAIKDSRGGTIYSACGGESHNGDASGNTVDIAGVCEPDGHETRILNGVIGGYANYGDASGNSVFLHTVKITGSIYGGNSNYSASYNTITVKNSRVLSNIVGGCSHGTTVETSGNKITVAGGKLTGSYIIGATGAGANTACDNIVTLSGDIQLEKSVSLEGYRGEHLSAAGNTLNLRNLNCADKWNSVRNFQKYSFQIDAGFASAAGHDVAGFVLFAKTIVMGGALVATIEITGGGELKAGDRVGLIKADTVFVSDVYSVPRTVQGSQGASTLYDFTVALENKQLIATVKSVRTDAAVKTAEKAESGVFPPVWGDSRPFGLPPP